MGSPTVFIRTTGCNLRCTYCDTTYAYEKGEEQSIKEILEIISTYHCKTICVTGGEPLLQKNICKLLTQLSKHSYNICLETNGSQPISSYREIDRLFFSMDIKCPSSRMHQHTDFSNLEHISSNDQLKCIIGSKEDYKYAKQILGDYEPNCLVFFQPVWGFSLQKLSSWILEDHLPVFLGIQLHKYIWREDTKK